MEADRLGLDILKEGVEKAMQQLKNGKLEGIYGIPDFVYIFLFCFCFAPALTSSPITWPLLPHWEEMWRDK